MTDDPAAVRWVLGRHGAVDVADSVGEGVEIVKGVRLHAPVRGEFVIVAHAP